MIRVHACGLLVVCLTAGLADAQGWADSQDSLATARQSLDQVLGSPPAQPSLEPAPGFPPGSGLEPLPLDTGIPFVPPRAAVPLAPAPAAAEPPLTAPPDLETPPAAPAPAVVAEVKPPKLWTGSFELGLAGTDGNSQTLDLRFGLAAKRKTEKSILSLDLDYHKTSSDGEETANRAFHDWRQEWLFGQSPWTCFIHGTVDYDEFQSFDLRVTADTGVGYQFIKTDATKLNGRLGGGFSREIGGPDDRYVPELIYGGDFEHRLSKRQKISLSAEYAPDVTDWADCRVKAKAGWEVLLDEEMNLSLKLSVLDRYDSTPNGAKPNDVDYSVVLLWTF